MEKKWCMCTELKGVARDGFSTCSICGGKDAYGESPERPKNKKKVLVVAKNKTSSNSDYVKLKEALEAIADYGGSLTGEDAHEMKQIATEALQ